MLLLFIIAINYSCKKKPKPASQLNTITTISINGYLGTCDSFFEGTKPITVTIDVDNLGTNGNIVSNFKNYRFFVQNDGNVTGNVEFPNITVPQSGSFSITVVSEAHVCYQCCSGPSCSSSDGGRPRFRGKEVFMNAKGVPHSVFVNLTRVSCD